MIRKCAIEKNLEAAKAVFEAAKLSSADLNSFMVEVRQAGMVDVVSFNTLVKAYFQLGHFAKGRALISEMKKEGIRPNKVTFNELINAVIAKSESRNCPDIWGIVSEMQAADVKPNPVTCSILLKCLNAESEKKNITRTMELVDTMDEPMDEVLLSSIVEACVRIGKPELLSKKLIMLKESFGVVNSAH